MRKYFFGPEASTEWMQKQLTASVKSYQHHNLDVRDHAAIFDLFRKFGHSISLVIHTAAQPSHDWAAKEPFTDFTVNANGTLNMLEMNRLHCPDAVFIFTSTNKVYGDNPNFLPLIETETRWEIDQNHPYYKEGIDEMMSIDH